MNSEIIKIIITSITTLIPSIIGMITTYFTSKASYKAQRVEEAKTQLIVCRKAIEKYVEAIDKINAEFKETGKISQKAEMTYKREINAELKQEFDAKPLPSSHINELVDEL